MKLLLLFTLLLSTVLADVIQVERTNTTISFSKPGFHTKLTYRTHKAKLNQLSISSNTTLKTLSTEEDLPIELQLFNAKIETQSINALNQFTLQDVSAENLPIVAVIDSGFDINNQVLQPYMYLNKKEVGGNGIDDDQNGYIDDVCGYNVIDDNGNIQDGFGHGTMVTGVIAQNSQGKVKILPIKAFNDQGMSTQFYIAAAFKYALAMGAKVINCSFGYTYFTELMQEAVQEALDKGVLVIASAGNQSQESILYPAAFDGVLAISALDPSDHLANFSNYGDKLSISALGVDVLSTYLGNQLARASGTSISAGIASGIAGSILASSQFQNSTSFLSSHCQDILDPLNDGGYFPGWDKYSGYGKLNAQSSQKTNIVQSGENSVQVQNFLNYPNPINSDSGTQFGFSLNKDVDVLINVYSLSGKKVWTTSIQAGSSGAQNGYNKITFPCTDLSGEKLANDTYIATLEAGSGQSEVKSKLLITIAR